MTHVQAASVPGDQELPRLDEGLDAQPVQLRPHISQRRRVPGQLRALRKFQLLVQLDQVFLHQPTSQSLTGT